MALRIRGAPFLFSGPPWPSAAFCFFFVPLGPIKSLSELWM